MSVEIHGSKTSGPCLDKFSHTSMKPIDQTCPRMSILDDFAKTFITFNANISQILAFYNICTWQRQFEKGLEKIMLTLN